MNNFEQIKKEMKKIADEIIKDYGIKDPYTQLAIHHTVARSFSIAQKEKSEVKS